MLTLLKASARDQLAPADRAALTAAVTSSQSCSKCWRSLASRFADEKVGSEVMDGSCPVKGTVAGPSPLDEPSLNLFAPERFATPPGSIVAKLQFSDLTAPIPEIVWRSLS